MNTSSRSWRYTVLGTLLSILPIPIVLRLILIQTNRAQAEAILDWGKLYGGGYVTIDPARGEIVDRWGHVFATNQLAYEVGVELRDISTPDTIALSLSLVLGLDSAKTLGLIHEGIANGGFHVTLADNVSPAKIDQLENIRKHLTDQSAKSDIKKPPILKGLTYSPHLKRTYPEKSTAANLIGFVGGDRKGYFGVEEKYNELLAGVPKTIWRTLNPNQAKELPPVPDGNNIVLTIDREIQAAMEQVVDRAIITNGASSGTIVVLDPRSGEVLAMATTPRLDLNEYWRYEEVFPKEVPFNRAVSQTYEPGSVYKVLTMAAAIDKGAINPDTVFVDRGVFEIGGTYIYNWNSGAWGRQTMLGCMQHSLNVCLAWIATQLGPKNFYAYMHEFGIGRQTGIELAGEAAGRLKSPGDADWYDADLGTNSFGQGVSATPIQMAAAISAVANDGKIMAPHIVRSMVNKGIQYNFEQRVVSAPISARTAVSMTELLAQSLEIESSDALVKGYRVAGKTGTAEIPTPFGYTTNQTNASFVGWGPADDPRFLVYVWIEKPSSSPWGSVVASPVFREAVEKLVVLMNIPPDDVRKQYATH